MHQFYEDVLPSRGSYCLFLVQSKRHVWFDSIDALVEGTNTEAQGVYFATASFHNSAARTQENVALRRCFAFDIDAGPEKFAKHGDAVYETQRDAIRAVGMWIKANSLPASYVVSSGAGLHVYFCLDRDATLDEWLPVAKGLKSMAVSQGLRIDPTVTADAARVLRPPGTLHGSGARVHIVQRTGTAYSLESLAARVAAFAPVERPKRTRSMNDEVLEAPVGPPKSIENVKKHCAAMRHALDSGGNVQEPYWRAMLGVIKHTMEGADAAHKYSQGHPDYDYDSTQEKFDRWTAGPSTCATFEGENPGACAGCEYRGKVRSPIQLGVLTLTQLDAMPKPAPAPAVEAGDGYTPFGADGAETAVEDEVVHPWTGYLPEGFFIVNEGGTWKLATEVEQVAKTETNDLTKVYVKQPFCSVPWWLESWAPGLSDNDQALATYRIYDAHTQRTRSYTIPTKSLAVRNDFMSVLASQNVQVFPSTVRAKNCMEDYIKAAMERIRAAGQRPKIVDRFGTMFNQKGDMVVAQGPYLITKTGDILEGVVQDKLRSRGHAYTIPLPHTSSGRWDKSVWQDHIIPRAKRHADYLNEFYSDRNFRPYQLAISLAIASPLLAFTQGNYYPGSELPGMGMTVTLFSPRSGIGKTSAMTAAALAYGVPNNIVSQLDRNNSTSNARGEMVLQAGTMPSFMDEMEDVPAADLASLISAVGNGVSKKRMNKDLSVTGGDKMSLVNVMSTNKSHREIAAADRTESSAVQMRLLEIECSSVQAVSRERALQESEARSAVADCAGALGAVLHYAMCACGPEQLNKLGLECSDVARGMLDGRQDGRLMWRALGALLMARRLLKKFGIKVFEDLDVLVAEFRHWHDASYEFAAEGLIPTDPDRIMSLFLSDVSNRTLITQSESLGGKQLDIVVNDRVPDTVVARSVLQGQYIYVKADSLREWCQHRKVSHSTLLQRCREMGIIEPVSELTPARMVRQVDLLVGTKMSQRVRVGALKILVEKLNGSLGNDLPATDNVRQLVRAEAPASQNAKSSAIS